MKKCVQPSRIDGNLRPPASKSYMQRAVAAALLADGTTVLRNPTLCDDARAALAVAESLGARVTLEADAVRIVGSFEPKAETLNCGESGLSIRMFTPIAALHDRPVVLTGEGSLLRRPVDMLETPLRQLGARVETNAGLLPILVQGPLRGGEADVDGRISSQMLTGLLLALPRARRDTTLRVRDLKSKPYVDMTLCLMRTFGVNVEHEDYASFRIPGNRRYTACEYAVEGDWSGAAFHLVAGAVAGHVELVGLNPHSAQGDRLILDALRDAGAILNTGPDTVAAGMPGNGLRPFRFDATDCPDLFPPLAVLAAFTDGVSRIDGVHRLEHKESNRACVLRKELGKLGIRIELDGDAMLVYGGTVPGGTMDAANDHRIAMAGAVAATRARGPVTIRGAECVSKSYPDFFSDFARLGARTDEP